MYSKIANLPLMLGISSEVILELQDRSMLHEKNVGYGELIVDSGTRCRGLLWVSEGKVRRTFRVSEKIMADEILKSPLVIEPECLMGIDNRYIDTYHAEGDTNLLYITKDDVNRILMRREFFRINLLSMMSTIAQRFKAYLNLPLCKDNEERFLRFTEELRIQKDSELTLRCNMNQIAEHLNMTRLNLSRILNKMKSEGKLVSKREKFIIL